MVRALIRCVFAMQTRRSNAQIDQMRLTFILDEIKLSHFLNSKLVCRDSINKQVDIAVGHFLEKKRPIHA